MGLREEALRSDIPGILIDVKGDLPNLLLASPSFASWRQGASLDIRKWLTRKDGRTPAVSVSVAHLDDEERALVLGVLLEEILAYTRSLRGSRKLKALVVFDEVYGLLPPHPANPPTKRPTVALMKQGRAFGGSPAREAARSASRIVGVRRPVSQSVRGLAR